MSENPVLSDRDKLLGSRWRDEHGNEYRVYSIWWRAEDPELKLEYISPTRKAITLSQLQQSHVALDEEDANRG
jgi:hypothetical protein